MNANETTPQSNFRLIRLKRIIKWTRWMLGMLVVIFLVAGACFLAGLFGWMPQPDGIKISFSPLLTYTAPFDIPLFVLFFALLRAGVFLTGVLILFWLLDLFEAGHFFTAQSVRHIKSLGALIIMDWVLIKVLDSMAHAGVEITFGHLVLGLLVFVIAWIMDEGRKIQEEQELTV